MSQPTFTPGRFDDLLMREPERCHGMAIDDDRWLGESMDALGQFLFSPPVLHAVPEEEDA